MTEAYTGFSLPVSCEVLRSLPLRQDSCYSCFDGLFCDENGEQCQNLTGCAVNGAQSGSLLYPCRENKKLTVRDNLKTQVVTTKQLDVRLLLAYILGLVVFALTIILTIVYNRSLEALEKSHTHFVAA